VDAPQRDADAAIEAALAALEETVGDREFVAELIGDFLAGLPAQLAALHVACADGDGEQERRIAHTLKSNAATFGAEALAGACRELEHLPSTGGAGTHALIARVEEAAAAAVPALTAAQGEWSA
jgi:HPt (histidine-containing phosphotransfer) domain-containing protein